MHASEPGDEPCTIIDGCGDQLDCGCSAEMLCDGVVSVERCEEVYVGGPVACALEALSSNRRGILEIETSNSDCGYLDNILILGDGTALLHRQDGEPVPTKRVRIQPPSFFAFCRLTDDPMKITECLLDWYSEELCGAADCCGLDVPDEGPRQQACS